jgi:hypothetical protein
MSKLAHSNQETMDKIERDARERAERGIRDEPPTTRIKPYWRDCLAIEVPGASCQFPNCGC